jgi:hypothetical protein
LKLLEENIGKSFVDLGTGNTFLNRILIIPEIRARMTNGTASN